MALGESDTVPEAVGACRVGEAEGLGGRPLPLAGTLCVAAAEAETEAVPHGEGL